MIWRKEKRKKKTKTKNKTEQNKNKKRTRKIQSCKVIDVSEDRQDLLTVIHSNKHDQQRGSGILAWEWHIPNRTGTPPPPFFSYKLACLL